MAKAREVPIEADEPFGEAADRVVAVRADELWEHLAGVLDTDDIERVHAARVATRRLRAVLEIFAACFPEAGHRAVLKDVKALADALGERRDPDVHLEALTALEAKVPEDQRAGTRHLADLQRARQEAGNDRLAAALQDVEDHDLRGRLAALVGPAE